MSEAAGGTPEDGDALAMIEAALARGEGHAVPMETIQRALTAAVKAYAARVEKSEGEFAPFADRSVTATEAVTAACAMIRAVDLNMFDVALWFGKPGPARG
jgi:hypothetical protein